MAGLLDSLAQIGVMKELPANISSEQIRQQYNTSTNNYPRDNDDPEDKDRSAAGHINPDVGGHTDQTEDVYVDANLLDQHVRELIQSAGGHYSFKRAVAAGTLVKVDGELLAALERLNAAGPLLAKAAERSLRREYGEAVLAKALEIGTGTTSARDRKKETGSTSGSTSGSVSGSESGEVSRAEKYRTIGLALREIMLARRKVAGSASGSVSGGQSGVVSGHASNCECAACTSHRQKMAAHGSASGSASGSHSGSISGSELGGQVSRTTVERAMQGHTEDALKLMGRC